MYFWSLLFKKEDFCVGWMQKKATRMEDQKVFFRRWDLSFFNIAEGKLGKGFLSVNSSNTYEQS